ncbi:MAG: hypothetical protein V4469_00720 [Patescibacteria group bacterium]
MGEKFTFSDEGMRIEGGEHDGKTVKWQDSDLTFSLAPESSPAKDVLKTSALIRNQVPPPHPSRAEKDEQEQQ